MKRRHLFIAAALAAVAAAIGWQLFEHYWYYIPGLVAAIRDPVGPTQEVHWNRGPEAATEPTSARPPNVVVILADDLGWNDLTFNGGGVAGGKVPTPNINSIGTDGIAFTQAYACDATCAPSRAAIMTGRYATRFGFEFTPAPVAFEKLISTFANGDLKPLYYSAKEKDIPASIDEETVPLSEITIAQVMKSKGYHTSMLGKWHLGGTPATRPSARGFDEALSFYPGASLYLAANDPNVVNSNGLEQNTLVIFTSDNDGADYVDLPDINKPFRGWKATFFEDGIHVPLFMK
jgi:arylsulfatase A-like enzyme